MCAITNCPTLFLTFQVLEKSLQQVWLHGFLFLVYSMLSLFLNLCDFYFSPVKCAKGGCEEKKLKILDGNALTSHGQRICHSCFIVLRAQKSTLTPSGRRRWNPWHFQDYYSAICSSFFRGSRELHWPLNQVPKLNHFNLMGKLHQYYITSCKNHTIKPFYIYCTTLTLVLTSKLQWNFTNHMTTERPNLRSGWI